MSGNTADTAFRPEQSGSPGDTAAIAAPRVWTVFVAAFAAFCGAIGAQVIAAICLFIWYIATEPSHLEANKLIRLVTSPPAFIFLSGLSQLAILGVAVVAAWLSPKPLGQRLGLVRPSMPAWTIAVLTLGVAVPFAIGLVLAIGVAQFIKPDPNLKALYEQMTPAIALPFIFYIALGPGSAEEILFRGYIQRRLLERWSAPTAILVTSVIFALFHVMPHAVVATFPLGIWLGVLAWRTGSVWPGIVCHATVNGAWNVRNVGIALGYFPEELPLAVLIALGALGTAAFIWSLWLLFASPAKATI